MLGIVFKIRQQRNLSSLGYDELIVEATGLTSPSFEGPVIAYR